MSTQNLLLELFVEELPPKALQKLGDAFSSRLLEKLRQLGLADASSHATPYASPRRLGSHITHVAAQASDQMVQHKLMPAAVGLDGAGMPTPALVKKLSGLGVSLPTPSQGPNQDNIQGLKRIEGPSGKADAPYLVIEQHQQGLKLEQGLQMALDEALAKLPIPKLMTYQLEANCELPGWSSVHFVRPVHGLLALHGSEVVAVQALGLKAGATTRGHRFEALADPVPVSHADAYHNTMRELGAVIASFGERRQEIEQQLQQAASSVSGLLGRNVQPVQDEALLDEVTALVERPKVLVCQFDQEFLSVPQECLILTMKANQKYFPLLDVSGVLTNYFLVVSNINPADPSVVVGGNERVVRPRLADAQFFFNQDRKVPLTSRVEGLHKVVYHNKLGSQAERMQRVLSMAHHIAELLIEAGAIKAPIVHADFLNQVDTASSLSKADLLTDMVGEFPELQGIMGGYYARHDGLDDAIAWAVEDHYKPRFAGDVLPRNMVGVVVALADKLETLVGMFGIGNVPTGDKDPFALRRHALGVLRMLTEKQLPLELHQVLTVSVEAFGPLIQDPSVALTEFLMDRLAGLLRDQGYGPHEIDAVLALHPQRLDDVLTKLEAVRTFASLPESSALAAANKRVGNILKKLGSLESVVQPELLQEPAEKALYEAIQLVLPQAQAFLKAGDLAAYLKSLAVLRVPVDAFFEGVMVNAEDEALRLNRQSLIKQLHQAMNRVADLSRLAA
ncbi:MAG: glycine--tRNA ligase subunit beta [Betaproteobacteria bacterium]|nr:glycine--tRNA ligase subunit beta [Betaproteobacteria bacterium]